MPTVHWFPFWKLMPRNAKLVTVVTTISVISVVSITWKMLTLTVIPSTRGLTSCAGIQQEPNNRLMASMELSGRLGNLMFQYAFLYVTSQAHGYQIVLPSTKELETLKETFEIDFSHFEKTGWDKSLTEKCFDLVEDDWDCAFVPKLVEKSSKNVHYKGYFQSWKYFVSYEDELRKMFRFRPHILNNAASILHKIIASRYNNTGVQPVLVGVHIRRGDVLNDKIYVDFGYNIADYGYVKNAMVYFRRKYSNVLFIACSNDVKWIKVGFETTSDVFIVEGNTAATDMALLSLTNHTIMTVGTFGWWISFLTNGHTVYYKYPFIPGSPLSKQFNGSTDTHLYPDWVGLEGDHYAVTKGPH